MNALDRVRKKFEYLRPGTDITDKSPSVGSVGASHRNTEKILEPGPLVAQAYALPAADAGQYGRGAQDERAAIMEHDGGLPRAEAERAAALRSRFPIAAANCDRLVVCDSCRHFEARREAQPDGWCSALNAEAWKDVPFECAAYAEGARHE
jgi:hypothetical protein